jgi:hypothetical protein
LQLGIARKFGNQFAQLRERPDAVRFLVDAHQNSLRAAAAQFFERNEFVDDEVRLVTASAAIDGTAHGKNGVCLHQLAKAGELFRPDNAADNAFQIFQIEHRILGVRLPLPRVLGLREFDGRKHAPHCHFSPLRHAGQAGCRVGAVSR